MLDFPKFSSAFRTAADETSWRGYVRHVIPAAGRCGLFLKCPLANIEAIYAQEYPLPAKQPSNSWLNTNRLQDTFGIRLPNWVIAVERMLSEISEVEILTRKGSDASHQD